MQVLGTIVILVVVVGFVVSVLLGMSDHTIKAV